MEKLGAEAWAELQRQCAADAAGGLAGESAPGSQ